MYSLAFFARIMELSSFEKNTDFIQYCFLFQYMKNDTGEIEYYGKGDISENSRFTLQQEQDYLPFLVRAIELWEKSLGPSKNGGQRSSNAAKSGKGRKSEVIEATETLFGVEHHVDSLILCGTRLIAMKQVLIILLLYFFSNLCVDLFCMHQKIQEFIFKLHVKNKRNC